VIAAFAAWLDVPLAAHPDIEEVKKNVAPEAVLSELDIGQPGK
jgi:hypothetical protein